MNSNIILSLFLILGVFNHVHHYTTAPVSHPTEATSACTMSDASDPIKINWGMLMDIDYELRYFEEVEMEIYAPVFPSEVKEYDGKVVELQGYVIPFDEEANLVALSYNPFAACFFCGNASPASVISLHLKEKKKRYKVDAFKKFKGTLQLNSDDPNEFYYILKDAEEVRE